MASAPPDDTQPQPWTGPPPSATSPTGLAARPDVEQDPSRLVEWIGWHLAEITGVTAPAVLAVTVDAWWAVLAVLVGGAWSGHEVRLCRRHRALAAERDQVTSRIEVGRPEVDRPEATTA